MPAPPSQPYDLVSLGVLITLAVALCVKFWRKALIIAVITILTLCIYGAIVLSEAMRHAHG